MTIEMIAIVVAGITIAIGSVGPALGEARVAASAMEAIARQPDMAGTITRTMFVSLAMIESTAIYCLLISMMLMFKLGPLFEKAVEAAAP
jgi:F-type H+-transporting ATPase subunit c